MKSSLSTMLGGERTNGGILSLLKRRTVDKERRIMVVGLKSDNFSRQMLLCLLNSVVKSGDSLLAIHVQDADNTFDPNTFHIHEDLCKSKKLDFQVMICTGSCYISELSHQVRINLATVLALGCSSGPKVSTISKCLKLLPPTCTLLVMNYGGRILIQTPGTSQQGSTANKILQSSQSALPNYTTGGEFKTPPQILKSFSMPCTSTESSWTSLQQSEVTKPLHWSDFVDDKVFERLATLDLKGSGKRFTLKELQRATSDFSPDYIIGEGGHSTVYRANLENGEAVAVKVVKSMQSSATDVLKEVEILSGLEHKNLVRFFGYCYTKEICAVVYNLLKGSLTKNLKHLRWDERVGVAIGVAKALDYLHSCSPPIIHRDVKSSNILLSDDCQPHLSDFGEAIEHQKNQKKSAFVKPNPVVGTFGYMAPEYIMYGEVDEKIDVYSYGVVLLELITGRGAIQTTKHTSKNESLVLQARSLLCSGLCERLIDPNLLHEEYDKEEMKMMMVAARLCLLHSSSKRPPMKTILRLFEEPEYWLEMQRKREEILNGCPSLCESGSYKHDNSGYNETLALDDD